MSPERLAEISRYRQVPMHNYDVLFAALDECVSEIAGLQRGLQHVKTQLEFATQARDRALQHAYDQERRLHDFVKLIADRPPMPSFVIEPEHLPGIPRMPQ